MKFSDDDANVPDVVTKTKLFYEIEAIRSDLKSRDHYRQLFDTQFMLFII